MADKKNSVEISHDDGTELLEGNKVGYRLEPDNGVAIAFANNDGGETTVVVPLNRLVSIIQTVRK